MKNIIYFILVALLVFMSCKKDASNPVNTDTIPLPPILSTPKDTLSEVVFPIVLTWSESSGAKSYTLQVSTSRSFSSFVFNKNDIVTTAQQISSLDYISVYYWRVSASNVSGTSDWSKVWSFTTTGEAAFVPQLSLPEDGAVDQKLSPILTWGQVSNASNYNLQISTNPSFTSFAFDDDSLITTTKQVKDLSGLTKYFWRVAATNNFGTKGWSKTWSFTTTAFSCGNSTVDYSGKTYNTVQVGTQCWLKENLDVGVFVTSTYTGSIHSNLSNNGIIEKYCHDNDEANCAIYGGLYDWNEAMQYVNTEKAKGICPTGWHIPTRTEFLTLKAAVSNNGNKLKREDQGKGSGIGTNTSGFSALLADIRNNTGDFFTIGDRAKFWISIEEDATYADHMSLYNTDSDINIIGTNKSYGFSIRCVKDE